jgi:hypothetical protein
MSTQEKLDEITEFVELFVSKDQERARLNLKHLIDSAKREVLEQIRPPQATIDSMKLTQPHKYRGVEYPCCSICGFCPEAINAFIDSQLEQSEESE